MGDFKKRFGGGGGFGGRGGRRGGFGGGGFDRGRGSVEMHQAVCDQCGQPCEVPFRPSGEKPVYCNTCFSGKKEMGDNRSGGDRFSRRPTPNFSGDGAGGSNCGEVKKQLEILNAKMDRLVRAIEVMAKIKPTGEVKVKEAAKEVAKTVSVAKNKKSPKK